MKTNEYTGHENRLNAITSNLIRHNRSRPG